MRYKLYNIYNFREIILINGATFLHLFNFIKVNVLIKGKCDYKLKEKGQLNMNPVIQRLKIDL